jgi:hypothetical protein
MSISAIPIQTVMSVSVAALQQGAGAFNVANLAIFTRETVANTFGSLGYKIYLNPTQVGVDFGTSSNTYAMAISAFSQQPNFLSAGGYLVVIPFLNTAQTAVQTISMVGGTGVPASGAFVLNYASNATSSIAYNATAATIQADLRAVTGLSSVTVTGTAVAGPIVVTFTGVSGAASLLTVTSNTLADANSITVVPTPATTTIGSSAETLDVAIARTAGLIQYFGILSAEVELQAVGLAAAAVVQTMNKMLFLTSFTQADVASGGYFDLIRSGGFTQTRCLPYFETNSSSQPTTSLGYAAAYAALLLSVNFNGSLTAINMNLKSLTGVQPDPSTSPTLLNLCQSAGADVYFAFAVPQGTIGKVICSGANDYSDNQFNLQWLVTSCGVSGFNYLAQTSTKVPQTEAGMTGFKGSQRVVCEQAVTNGFLAPGTWTNPTTFGNQTLFYQNIAQRGYYIFSSPISQQLPTVRAARQSPLIQIAIQYAGAVNKGSAVIYVNP